MVIDRFNIERKIIMSEIFTIRLNQALSKRDMKPVDLANKSKLSKASISQYLNGVYVPKPTKLYLLAEALNVNPAWLMGHDVPMEYDPKDLEIDADRYENFSKNDKKDISSSLNFLIEQLNADSALMFDGEPLDDESKELLKSSLENSLNMGKMIAKQKYTPNKYKK